MKALTIVEPFRPTARVSITGMRDPVYVCNPFDEITAAVAGDEKFIAHQVLALEPSPMVLNPKYITAVEAIA